MKDLDYWELRKEVSKIIPRQTVFLPFTDKTGAVKEKGRKGGYKQFDLISNKWKKHERLLNTEEVKSFLEISIRAAACPMPLNLDVWDSLCCPFGCKYCFADAFRASLYTAFFDNSKTMGLRHCNPTYYKKELDKVMKFRGKDPHSISSDIAKAVAMEIPMRLGIRFEDFTYREKKVGVSLQMLQYLSDMDYPVMINTKSDVIGMEPYVEALSSNKGKAAVHITMITSDEEFLKKIEPGAPSFKKRIQAAKNLTDEGIRVVARIEPYMIFMTDGKDALEYYISELKRAGIKNITFDTYSYSANNPGIKRSFEVQGFDFRRMFLLISDSQALGSLLLTKFMNIFQENGFSCSTFDIGNSSNNDQTICCEVGDWFDGGWNNGCGVVAARYIIENSPHPVTWKQFENWVMEKGGFLSAALKTEVKKLWCLDGNTSFHISWAKGLEPVGMDENGLIWKYSPKTDYRKKILKGMMK